MAVSNGVLFGGQNPLHGNTLLDFKNFDGFVPYPGGRKVRGVFEFSEKTLLMVTSDKMGASG